jgi:hypothetical protein
MAERRGMKLDTATGGSSDCHYVPKMDDILAAHEVSII